MPINLSLNKKQPTYTVVQEQDNTNCDIDTVLYKDGEAVGVLYWIDDNDGRLHLLTMYEGTKALEDIKAAGIALRKTDKDTYVVDVTYSGLYGGNPFKGEDEDDEDDSFTTFRVPRLKAGDTTLHEEVAVNDTSGIGIAVEQIYNQFVWQDTPEGHDYWQSVVERLQSLEKYGEVFGNEEV